MKIHFSRNEVGETIVQLIEKGAEIPFNYITLVKHVIKSAKLEQTTFGEGFTPEEKDAVGSMVQLLLDACKKETLKSKT